MSFFFFAYMHIILSIACLQCAYMQNITCNFVNIWYNMYIEKILKGVNV